MALAFETFDADGAAVSDGVFIPVADLPGVLAAELAPGGSWESYFVPAMLEQIRARAATLGINTLLGLTITLGNAGAVAGVPRAYSNVYTVAMQIADNLGDNTVPPAAIPVPTVGDNLDVGAFAITDLFPGASKVAAAGNTGGAGVLIPSSLLEDAGNFTHAALDISAGQDNRMWLYAFISYTRSNLDLRSATLASAITAVAAPSQTFATPAGALIAAANPTSGIPAAEAPNWSLITVTMGVTAQTIDDFAARTSNPRVVTA